MFAGRRRKPITCPTGCHHLDRYTTKPPPTTHRYHHRRRLARNGWHSRRRRPPVQNDVDDTDATMAERKKKKSAGRSMDPSNGFRGWDYLWARLENVARVIRFGTAS